MSLYSYRQPVKTKTLNLFLNYDLVNILPAYPTIITTTTVFHSLPYFYLLGRNLQFSPPKAGPGMKITSWNKISSVKLAPAMTPVSYPKRNPPTAESKITMKSWAGYLEMSATSPILEGFLRSNLVRGREQLSQKLLAFYQSLIENIEAHFEGHGNFPPKDIFIINAPLRWSVL